MPIGYHMFNFRFYKSPVVIDYFGRPDRPSLHLNWIFLVGYWKFDYIKWARRAVPLHLTIMRLGFSSYISYLNPKIQFQVPNSQFRFFTLLRLAH